MFENKDDTILARWLAGKLTLEEQEDFEATPEYAEFVAIKNGLDKLQKPNFDPQSLHTKIQEKIYDKKTTSKKSKVITFKPIVYSLGIAASIVLIIGVFFNEVTYSTQVGERLTVNLPDGSTVQLNASTQLKRKRFFWTSNKRLQLDGEALFSVEKGEDFFVETNEGTIAVLGTQFNIKTRKDNFLVACYEGLVQFTQKESQLSKKLKTGEAINVINNSILEIEASDVPDWMKGQSTFKSVALPVVFEEFKNHYDVDFVMGKIDPSKKFTGSFDHDNLELALKSITLTMGLKYTISQDKKTVQITKR